MRGETRRKARRRYPADEALRRVSPRRRRERRRRERERGRATEHRAELPRVPCAALFQAEAGRNLSGRGGFDRTAARRRICIRQAAAWTEKPPAQKGEHGCPKQSRTLIGKPARHSNSPCHMRIAFILKPQAQTKHTLPSWSDGPLGYTQRFRNSTQLKQTRCGSSRAAFQKPGRFSCPETHTLRPFASERSDVS